jgi:tetratricopeptide (TPR) repeat protein
MWKDVLLTSPENRRALLAVAQDRMQNNDLATARQLIDKAMDVESKSKSKLYEVPRMKGKLMMAERNYAQAATAFQEAATSYPESESSWYDLHQALLALNKPAEALAALEHAATLAPANAQWQWEYANALMQVGRLNDAIRVYEHAAKTAPDSGPVHSSLGAALAQAGRIPDALVEFDAAAKLQPNDDRALFNRGYALELMHRPAEALDSYRAALKARPERPDISNAIAWILATSPQDALRNGKEAVTFALKACELTRHKNPLMLDTLAAAYAEAGQFDEAAEAAGEALKAAPQGSPLAKDIQAHLELFKAGKAFHQARN